MDKEIRNQYQEVIGLEIHLQLLTKTKAYSSDANEYGSLPNTNVNPITLGHPGTLPKPNKTVYDFAICLGLATGCNITEYNYYDRKNYFYPDLPKGYQITQDKTPICTDGVINITLKDGSTKAIRIERIHMEEDAGKSMHLDGEEDTLVDLNRAGVPLLEIVTKPDIRSSEEAYAYLTEVRKLVRYLEICDGNMEEGSLRCDANISVMHKDASKFGNRAEVKNMNSIRNVSRAIDFEIERQINLVEKGEKISVETRLFDAVNGTTRSMRTKEGSNDYRYFPEPDLQPVIVNEEWIESVRKELPALPHELKAKFIEKFQLPEYDAQVLTDHKEIALYFDELCRKTSNYKAASNWVMGPIKSYINELTLSMSQFPLTTDKIAEIISLVDENKIADSTARQKLFPQLVDQPNKKALDLANELNLVQDSDQGAIESIVESVLAKYPEKVEAYKSGQKGLLGMFMGEVMKLGQGKVDPKVANQMLSKKLNN